jgi:hypothetical protein
MRAVVLAAMAACCSVPASLAARPRQAPPACSLTPGELDARRDELLPALLDRATSVRRLRHGVRLTFDRSPGLVTDLATIIENERQCCSFLRFRLVTAEGAGHVVLEVRGPRGTARLLEKLRGS